RGRVHVRPVRHHSRESTLLVRKLFQKDRQHQTGKTKDNDEAARMLLPGQFDERLGSARQFRRQSRVASSADDPPGEDQIVAQEQPNWRSICRGLRHGDVSVQTNWPNCWYRNKTDHALASMLTSSFSERAHAWPKSSNSTSKSSEWSRC